MAICMFYIEQALSIRALQEMMSAAESKQESVRTAIHCFFYDNQQIIAPNVLNVIVLLF